MIPDYLPRRWEDVDREWEREPDQDRWEHAGLRCAVLRADMLVLCGYVGLPSRHPLFGVGPRDRIPSIDFLLQRRLNSPPDIQRLGLGQMLAAMMGDGEEPTMENALSVHGGITWCSRFPIRTGPRMLNRTRWWVGFDCGHSGDLMPGIQMQLRELHNHSGAVWGVYRNMAYAREETERLARQLSIFQ